MMRITKHSRGPRIDKARLFEDLGYWPHAGQQTVHESKALRRVVACGVRWGKTSVGVYEVVAALLEPRDADSIGWVVGPDHTVGDRILKLAHRVLEKYSPHRILEARNHTLRVRNLAGKVATVEGRSGENPASLLGEGLDWLVVDEAARLKDSVWDEHLSQRLVEKRGWALLLSTPRGAGWFYVAFRRGRGEDPGYESWTAPTWENPFIDRAAVEAERARLDEATFDQEYGGKFIGHGIPQCEVCGYPRAEHGPVVILIHPEKLGTCDACGHTVMKDGRALAFDDGSGIVEHTITLRSPKGSSESQEVMGMTDFESTDKAPLEVGGGGACADEPKRGAVGQGDRPWAGESSPPCPGLAG